MPAPASQTGESSLLRWLKDRRITEVECLVPDMTGNARGKIIPAAKFSHDYGTRLPEGIFVTTVTGDYPDEYYELVVAIGLGHVPAPRPGDRAHGAVGVGSDRADHPRLLHPRRQAARAGAAQRAAPGAGACTRSSA